MYLNCFSIDYDDHQRAFYRLGLHPDFYLGLLTRWHVVHHQFTQAGMASASWSLTPGYHHFFQDHGHFTDDIGISESAQHYPFSYGHLVPGRCAIVFKHHFLSYIHGHFALSLFTLRASLARTPSQGVQHLPGQRSPEHHGLFPERNVRGGGGGSLRQSV
mmetsp:Transcript_110994/g.324668  ORF Transcript_110994/g.324668 Transcript_110994/m.324668 type:complete len:160 (+) Transcript_110994:325-804(+)